MPRPIYAEIDIQALKHNLARLRESVGDRTLWAVVKANAYGHGLENAVEAFADADGFATIDLCDAERARRAGWHKRVLLLEGFFDETDIEPLQDLDVETVVHSMWQIDILKRLQLREVKVHIKVNSGMNRLGFLPVEVGTIYDLLTSIPGVKVMGVVTHFANAEPSYLPHRSPDSSPAWAGSRIPPRRPAWPTPLPSSGIPKWEVTACVRALRFTA